MQPVPQVNTKAMRPSTQHPSARTKFVYFFFSAWLCSFSTFLTIFCSSMRKARTMRSRTQLPHLEPPYARWTVFLGLEIWAYSWGRRAGTCEGKAASQHAIVRQLLFPRAKRPLAPPKPADGKCGVSPEKRAETKQCSRTVLYAAFQVLVASQSPYWSIACSVAFDRPETSHRRHAASKCARHLHQAV